MNHDDKLIERLGAVLCAESLLFLGCVGPSSKISIFRFLEGTSKNKVKYIGSFSPIFGSIKNLITNTSKTKLSCCTSCGYVYVWDISEPIINRLESLTNNPLYSDGYIPQHVRILPILVIEPENLSECAYVDFMYDDKTLIGVSRKPGLDINFYDSDTGKKIASGRGMLGQFNGTDHYVNCVKVDSQPMRTKDNDFGHWVVFGLDHGVISLIFVQNSVLEGIKSGSDGAPTTDDGNVTKINLQAITHKLADHSTNILSLALKLRGSSSLNLTVLAGCSDGAVHCCVFQFTESQSLTPYKQASYLYCRGAIKASVSRVLCCRESEVAAPFVVAACNMELETGHNDTLGIKSNFDGPRGLLSGEAASQYLFEGVYQRLVQDCSDNIVSFAKIPDYITDISVSPNGSEFVVLASFNDNVYICERDTTNEKNSKGPLRKSPWKEPKKIELHIP